jgi:hypothetical protein
MERSSPHPVPLPMGEGTLEQRSEHATPSPLPEGEGQGEGLHPSNVAGRLRELRPCYLSLSVARPNRARITAMIQKRTTTVASAQPFCSKW